MPLHGNQGNCLPLLSTPAFLSECAVRVSRIIEVGAKWQAASVRSQVMGLGKWAVMRGGYYTGTCRCLFSVTRPIGVERKNAMRALSRRQDETTSTVERRRTR